MLGHLCEMDSVWFAPFFINSFCDHSGCVACFLPLCPTGQCKVNSSASTDSRIIPCEDWRAVRDSISWKLLGSFFLIYKQENTIFLQNRNHYQKASNGERIHWFQKKKSMHFLLQFIDIFHEGSRMKDSEAIKWSIIILICIKFLKR